MKDQAKRLRELVKNKRPNLKKDSRKNLKLQKDSDKWATIYTVTSGKGGVGKSNFTANLALALQEYGKKVAIFDADLGMANLDVILGVVPGYNLTHVINGSRTLEDIMIKGPGGLFLIPGGSGIEELANLSHYQVDNLIESWKKIGRRFDIILIDTGAGLADNTINFVLAADEVVIITTPEPTAITDAYGVIKVISKHNREISIRLVINQVENDKEEEKIGRRLIKTASDFLGVDIQLLGGLPYDNKVVKAVKRRTPFLLEYPNSKVGRGIKNLAAELIDVEVTHKSKGIKGFFNNLFGR